MKNELRIKKCRNCGTAIDLLSSEDKGLSFTCCGELMLDAVANTEEAAIEKHKPTFEKVEDEIVAKVNHVMEKEHYIEWMALVKENKKIMVTLYPEQDAEVRFPYISGSTLYAYCNKHGLWSTEVD